jgi:hypothetical protein
MPIIIEIHAMTVQGVIFVEKISGSFRGWGDIQLLPEPQSLGLN